MEKPARLCMGLCEVRLSVHSCCVSTGNRGLQHYYFLCDLCVCLRACMWGKAVSLMENLSSFPLCHSSGPLKKVKNWGAWDKGGGSGEGMVTRSKKKSFRKKRFTSILEYRENSVPQVFCRAGRKSSHRGGENGSRGKDKSFRHTQLSNCGRVQSYKCLRSYLCYLYPCIRLRTSTLSQTPVRRHTPALENSQLCISR